VGAVTIWLGYERHDTEFLAETARLVEVTTGVDPATPVPWCPEWTVQDPVTHDRLLT